MNEVTATKAKLRKELIAVRDSLSFENRQLKSKVISKQVEELLTNHFSTNNTCKVPQIALYSTMGSEVDTLPLIEIAARHKWNTCFPFMIKESITYTMPFDTKSSMEFFAVDSQKVLEGRADILSKPLKRHSRNDLEALGFELVLPQEIDAIIVPMVGFDDSLKRIGYGGGNYDSYLCHLGDNTCIIGIAFEEQRTGKIPLEPHDLSLPVIVHA